MIADFMAVKDALDKMARAFRHRRLVEHSVFLSRFGTKWYAEGDTFALRSEDGQLSARQHTEYDDSIQVEKNLPLRSTVQDILELIDAEQKRNARKMDESVTQHLQETLKGTPSEIKESATPWAYLRALEKNDLDFDDKTGALSHVPMVSPAQAEEYKRAEASMTKQDKQEYSRRLECILSIKRKEYDERVAKYGITD